MVDQILDHDLYDGDSSNLRKVVLCIHLFFLFLFIYLFMYLFYYYFIF